jgi:hypothetical protein
LPQYDASRLVESRQNKMIVSYITYILLNIPYIMHSLITSFTWRDIRRSRLSIVDNIANFKMPLIDGAETVFTVLNNSIKFRLGNY